MLNCVEMATVAVIHYKLYFIEVELQVFGMVNHTFRSIKFCEYNVV